MLEGGADVRFIQAMGHAKLETTQIYTQMSIRHLTYCIKEFLNR